MVPDDAFGSSRAPANSVRLNSKALTVGMRASPTLLQRLVHGSALSALAVLCLMSLPALAQTPNASGSSPPHSAAASQQRDPLVLETSVPGVFAAGDLRAGAMNRVVSAVGEGSMVVRLAHEYLALT